MERWNTRLKNLRDRLADLYFDTDQARIIVDNCGLSAGRISGWSKSPLVLWHNIVDESRKLNKIEALADAALEDYPDDDILNQIQSGGAQAARGPQFDKSLAWQGLAAEELQEKIVGDSQLLPVSYLEQGFIASKSVGRIITPRNEVGTGFLIDGNLLVTNHHVISNADIARGASVEFNFQAAVSGASLIAEKFAIDPDKYFRSDSNADICVVFVQDNPCDKYGSLAVDDLSIHVGEGVSIIQHPGGNHKQVALQDNTVVYEDTERLQYLTDTMPGSSGSPLFNRRWELVGIHHSGGWLREPNSKKRSFRNEGTKVKMLIELIGG